MRARRSGSSVSGTCCDDGPAVNEDRYDPTGWPVWAFAVSLALMTVLATLMVATATDGAVVAPLAVATVLPWGFHLVGRHPPVGWFLALSVVPLVLVNTLAVEAAGEATVLAACMAVFIQGEAVAAYRPRDAVLGVLAGGLVLALYARSSVVSVPAVYLVSATAGAVTIGYLLRRQQQTVFELRTAQDRLVGEAALQERQRVAREVHDVVAHSLTVTMMHVTAARMAIRRDPASAVEALEEAERLGRQSLDEIRRTVAVLRQGDERATDRALPSPADLDALVEGYRAAGVPVTFDVAGRLDELDPPVALAVYRLVQEAIGNAAKHAPGTAVDVRVRVGTDGAWVHASNPLPVGAVVGRSDRAGLGLVGMRERVALLGGAITAGPRHGRWVVEARLAPEEPGDGESRTRCR